MATLSTPVQDSARSLGQSNKTGWNKKRHKQKKTLSMYSDLQIIRFYTQDSRDSTKNQKVARYTKSAHKSAVLPHTNDKQNGKKKTRENLLQRYITLKRRKRRKKDEEEKEEEQEEKKTNEHQP